MLCDLRFAQSLSLIFPFCHSLLFFPSVFFPQLIPFAVTSQTFWTPSAYDRPQVKFMSRSPEGLPC